MKRITQKSALIVLSTLLASCSGSKAPSKSADAAPSAPQVVSGEIVVQLKSQDQLAALKTSYKVTTVDAESKVYKISSPSFTGREISATEELQKSGNFLVVEPNFKIQLKSDAPRDPMWMNMWSLKNYGQQGVSSTEGRIGSDIGAMEAWKVTKGSNQILVGIIDTGMDYKHPDLAANVFVNEAEANGKPGVDDDGNGYVDDINGWDFVDDGRTAPAGGQVGDADPMDDQSHGTHVAGTIGAVGNNGIGVTGINWTVKMMPMKFLDSSGSGNSVDEYRAIKYATKMGVDVVNASYGGGGKSALVEAALKEAGEKGMLFVAAAGNESSNNDTTDNYPSNYNLPNILAVAATDNNDQLAYFSNYGYKKVHIAAPGVKITSTVPTVLDGKVNPNPYATYSGTSMATPHVVGAAALVLAARPELRKNPAALKKALMESADVLPQFLSKVECGGRLNLAKAVAGTRSSHPFANGSWKEEAVGITTPHHPTDKWDYVWTVTKPGAKAIKLHIAAGAIDSADVVSILDSERRVVATISDMTYDMWLPPVLGDTVYVKFSNAIVQEASPRTKSYDDINLVDWRTYNFCERQGSKYLCSETSSRKSIFPNFASDGLEIDRMSVLQ